MSPGFVDKWLWFCTTQLRTGRLTLRQISAHRETNFLTFCHRPSARRVWKFGLSISCTNMSQWCVYIQGIHKIMLRYQKLTRNLFLNLTRSQRKPSAAASVQVSHALQAVRLSCSMRSQFPRWRRSRKKVFCMLRFEVFRSVITVQREFRARYLKDTRCIISSSAPEPNTLLQTWLQLSRNGYKSCVKLLRPLDFRHQILILPHFWRSSLPKQL